MDVDIWAWVEDTRRELHEAGNQPFAAALGGLPVLALEGKYAQLNVVAPAIAQQGRQLGRPWLEFFARYWHLLGRIGDQAQGEVALGDAQDLVAFAQREDIRDCPSVPAAVEALAMAQGNTDGPGYAKERLTLVRAAIKKIKPSSLAYSGLATQYLAALLDAGRATEAVAYVEKVAKRMSAADGRPGWELGAMGARALLAVGRAEEALGALEAATGLKPDDPVAKPRREALLRALILTHLGRHKEAVEALPDVEAVAGHPRDHLEWARTVRLLADHGQIANGWQLGQLLRQWINYFEVMGCHRTKVELAIIAGELAVLRHSPWQARELANLADSWLGALKVADGLPERIAALRAAAEAAAPPAAPGPEERLVELFDAADPAESDPEQWVAWLWPLSGKDLEATRRHTTTLAFLGYPHVGADILWRYLVDERDPAAADPEDLGNLTLLLIQAGQDARVEELAARLPAAQAHLTRARLYRQREDWPKAAAEAERAVAAGAGLEARRIWALAAQQQDDNAKGAEILRDGLRADELEQEDVWRMIVMATVAEDWATVREGAAKLGMPLRSAEGPIEEEWHLVRAMLPSPDGGLREVMAVRTGPATARLLVAQPPGLGYNAGDVVVIDPVPLEPVPEDPKEQERYVIPFRAVAMLRPGEYTSWFFDGAAPTEEEWAEFNQVLAERGWALGVFSDENYKVTDPETGEQIPGVFGWIAVPPSVTPVELDAVLDDLTETWVHPLAWLDLAREVGVEVERHEEIVKKYGL